MSVTSRTASRVRAGTGLATAITGLIVALGPGAVASSRPCTHLLVDPSGDATVSNPNDGGQLLAAGNDPSLDLLSADLSANKSEFAMVVRTGGDMRQSLAATGHSVELVFQAIGEKTWNLSATFPAVGPIGVRLGLVQQGGSAMSGEATLSADGKTLRASVPIADFEAQAGRPLLQQSRVTELHLYSNRAVAVENSGFYTPTPADAGTTSRSYRVGDKACSA